MDKEVAFEGHLQLSTVLEDSGALVEASEHVSKASLIKPDDARLRVRGALLVPAVSASMEAINETRRALETEKDHVEGFGAEVAWVTKSGGSDLAEPIAIRARRACRTLGKVFPSGCSVGEGIEKSNACATSAAHLTLQRLARGWSTVRVSRS